MLGSDVAGVVEAVGDGVTRFVPGSEVYGDNLGLKGGFAEYCLAPESALAHKPAGLTFVDASTIPQSGGHRPPGHGRGADPGSGSASTAPGVAPAPSAIQLAKRAGAHVTAVDHGGQARLMHALGADAVVDHTREDCTHREPYDLVLDLVAHRSVFAYRRALAPGGRYRCVGGAARTLLRVVTVGAVVGAASGRRIGVLAVQEGPEHFSPLAALCVSGEVAVQVDRTFGLDEVPEALAHVGHGRAVGKVVVEVG